MLYDRRGRREAVVRVRRAADDQVDFFGVDMVVGQKFIDGLNAQKTGAFGVVVQYSALLDADTGGDPFVVGVHHLRQHLIVQNVVGHI